MTNLTRRSLFKGALGALAAFALPLKTTATPKPVEIKDVPLAAGFRAFMFAQYSDTERGCVIYEDPLDKQQWRRDFCVTPTRPTHPVLRHMAIAMQVQFAAQHIAQQVVDKYQPKPKLSSSINFYKTDYGTIHILNERLDRAIFSGRPA